MRVGLNVLDCFDLQPMWQSGCGLCLVPKGQPRVCVCACLAGWLAGLVWSACGQHVSSCCRHATVAFGQCTLNYACKACGNQGVASGWCPRAATYAVSPLLLRLPLLSIMQLAVAAIAVAAQLTSAVAAVATSVIAVGMCRC